MEKKKLDVDERETWEGERRRGEVAKRGDGGGGGGDGDGDGGGGRLKWRFEKRRSSRLLVPDV